MMFGNRTAGLAPWIMLGWFAQGCAKAPPAPQLPQAPALPPITIVAPVEATVRASMTLATSADSNPDATGRPSPIVIRVYQLRAEGAFTGADFFPLFDDSEKVLGPELVTRDEYVMAPGERRSIDVTFARDARFVGVLAAFRDVRNAQWRAVVAVPKGSLTVSVERARVAVSSPGN
jgi:type VI secretion system protein VasD